MRTSLFLSSLSVSVTLFVRKETAVAKSLFATKRARPDIATAASFLTTRVTELDKDYWKKLVRMIRYLNGSPDLPLNLKADSTSIIKWWVDGSYAVHPD